MARSNKLSDIQIRALGDAYLGDRHSTKTALRERLAAEFRVSVPTVRRLAKAHNWDGLREISKVAVQAGVVEAVGGDRPSTGLKVTIEGMPVPLDEALATLMNRLLEEAQNAPCKSKEGAVSAWIKAAELYLRLHPPTMRDWVDRAFELPDFDPTKLAKFIRERYFETNAPN